VSDQETEKSALCSKVGRKKVIFNIYFKLFDQVNDLPLHQILQDCFMTVSVRTVQRAVIRRLVNNELKRFVKEAVVA
jgi:hypothetical protein